MGWFSIHEVFQVPVAFSPPGLVWWCGPVPCVSDGCIGTITNVESVERRGQGGGHRSIRALLMVGGAGLMHGQLWSRLSCADPDISK